MRAQPKTSFECYKTEQDALGLHPSPEKFDKLDAAEKRRYLLAAEADLLRYREVPPHTHTCDASCCAPLRPDAPRSVLPQPTQ